MHANQSTRAPRTHALICFVFPFLFHRSLVALHAIAHVFTDFLPFFGVLGPGLALLLVLRQEFLAGDRGPSLKRRKGATGSHTRLKRGDAEEPGRDGLGGDITSVALQP